MNPIRSAGIMVAIIGSGGALAGAVHGGINLFKFKASDLIDAENKFFLLGIDDNDAWNDSWEAYKLNNFGKATDEWGIKDWKTFQNAPEEFKNICKSSASWRVSNIEDPLYANITSYCARPKKLSEAFEKEGIRLLDTSGNTDTWIDKYFAYQNYLDLLPLSGDEVSMDSYDRLVKGCKALSNIETTNIDYERSNHIANFLCTE